MNFEKILFEKYQLSDEVKEKVREFLKKYNEDDFVLGNFFYLSEYVLENGGLYAYLRLLEVYNSSEFREFVIYCKNREDIKNFMALIADESINNKDIQPLKNLLRIAKTFCLNSKII
ncbi:MAG: hypothetical protein QW197_02960 [Candidatus Aenigmatarchaeota archaeon]